MTLVYLTIWYGLVFGQSGSASGTSSTVQYQKFGPMLVDSCMQAAAAINKAQNFSASCAGGSITYTMPSTR